MFSRTVVRPALMAAAALLAGTALAVVPAAPARADAVNCKSDGEPIESDYNAVEDDKLADEIPWSQQLLGTDRLADLATGKGVTVAVLDSGVDGRHELLKGKVDSGEQYVTFEGDKTSGGAADNDCMGHGTAVASLIAADRSDVNGFEGLAPGATILPMRVSTTTEAPEKPEEDEDPPPLTPQKFAGAITDAVEGGAKVINMSLKYSYENPDIAAAIKDAIDNKVTVVASAGNGECTLDPDTHQYESADVWPAKYPGVIGVGAVDQNVRVLESSQCGDWVDVVAPGAGLVAAQPHDMYTKEFGATSGATAFVSATAALLYELHPQWSAQQISDQLLNTASPASGPKGSSRYGKGLIDPYRALSETPMSGDAAEPADMADMVTPELNDEAKQRHADFADMNTWSLWIGLVAVAVFVAALLGVGALRRGQKAGWNVKRVNKAEHLEPFDDGDPIPLHQGIKGLKQ
jgi:membrane-anchored mycosin MYCP